MNTILRLSLYNTLNTIYKSMHRKIDFVCRISEHLHMCQLEFANLVTLAHEKLEYAALPVTASPRSSLWVTPSSLSSATTSAQRLFMNLSEDSTSPHTLSAEWTANFNFGDPLKVSILAVTENVISVKQTLAIVAENSVSFRSFRSCSS